MFVLITSSMNAKSIVSKDAELYDTLRDALDWVETSQGYDLEGSGKLQKYTIYEASEVAIDSKQPRGYFVRSGSEIIVYKSFNELVELVTYDNEMTASIEAEYLEEFGPEFVAKWKANEEVTKLYRLANEPIQIITEVIDEELIAA